MREDFKLGHYPVSRRLTNHAKNLLRWAIR